MIMTSTATKHIFGDKKLKRKLIQSVDSVRNKVKALRDNKSLIDSTLKQTFEPITKPLNILTENLTTTPITKDEEQTHPFKTSTPKNKDAKKEIKKEAVISSMPQPLLDNNSSDDSIHTTFTDNDDDDDYHDVVKQPMRRTHDKETRYLEYISHLHERIKIPFGAYMQNDAIFIGDSLMKLIDDSTFQIKNHKYTITPGLLELVFKKIPNHQLIENEDVKNYVKILNETNAYRRGFEASGQVQGDKSVKYNTYIKPFIKKEKPLKGGGGLGVMSSLIQKKFYPNTDYIYWDDPNELVDRLRLLLMSQNAGNTGHTNEINSIIEELIEGGIIIRK